ncbi:MAG: prepilin-type N-terminal cleavage/methylation domain-containing protein [Actinomycetota bacterium]|nr:prepilin-type N-terminal cleavage/methylation domain-containing protein [Actinomycetota bacterium]
MTPRDAGFSLAEIVVSIALMGVAVVPLMLAVITQVRVSSSTNTIADLETVLVNAADRVNRSGESCDYDVYVEAAALEHGWQPNQATAVYQYYDPVEPDPADLVNHPGSPIEAGTWINGACPGTQRPEGLVQRVTITVTSPDGQITRSLVVVKSDV